MKKTGIVVAVLVVLTGWAVLERRELFIWTYTLTSAGEPPPLLPVKDEGPHVRWIDDYFTVELVAPDTWAIGEPRYAQQNYSYLITGRDRALLFDAGPGIRDMRATAESLTDRPITFLPSHFHYDHAGNGISFDEIAVLDLPYIRERVAADGTFSPTRMEHLCSAEGFSPPGWKVDHWWAPGTRIDLGGRTLTLFHTPGHTTDSISLLDANNRLLFSGGYPQRFRINERLVMLAEPRWLQRW